MLVILTLKWTNNGWWLHLSGLTGPAVLAILEFLSGFNWRRPLVARSPFCGDYVTGAPFWQLATLDKLDETLAVGTLTADHMADPDALQELRSDNVGLSVRIRFHF